MNARNLIGDKNVCLAVHAKFKIQTIKQRKAVLIYKILLE